MRQYETEGLSRESLQLVYELVLTQKLVLEEKLERMVKELAVAIVALEDGVITGPEQMKMGLINLLVFAETHIKLNELMEYDEAHANIIKVDGSMVKEMTLEQIKAKIQEVKKTMSTPPGHVHVID